MRMWKWTLMVVAICGVWAPAGNAQQKPDIRTFTRAADQKELKAFIVSHDGEKVTVQVAGRKQFTLDPKIFVEADQEYIFHWWLKSRGMPLPDELDERIQPGETFRVEIDGLEDTKQDKPGGFSLRIPENYKYPEPVPILVFLSGGKGGENINTGRSISNPEDFVIAGLPFPASLNTSTPVAGRTSDEMEAVREYHAKMLAEIQRLVPNLHPVFRVVAGTSNGAHTVGFGLTEDWDCYMNFFHGFVMWEGGRTRVDYNAARGKDRVVWVGWGEKSSSMDYSKAVLRDVEDANVQVWSEGIATAGHPPNDDAKAAMKKWITVTAAEEMVKIEAYLAEKEDE